MYLKLLVATFLCALLSGCQKSTDESVSAAALPASTASDGAGTTAATKDAKPGGSPFSPQDREFMRAVYGESFKESLGGALVMMKPMEGDSEEDEYFLVTPLGFKLLKSGDVAVFVVNAEPASAEGGSVAGYASRGQMSVYLLKKEGAEDWSVIQSHVNVDAGGVNGQVGSVQWIELTKNVVTFAVVFQGLHMGQLDEWMDLYGVDTDGVHPLTKESIVLAFRGGFDCDFSKSDCIDYSSTYQVVARSEPDALSDIVQSIKGRASKKVEKANGGGTAFVTEDLARTIRYRYGSDGYVIVEGSHPGRGS